MSASIQELKDELRERAIKKRGSLFEHAEKPQELTEILAALREALKVLSALLGEDESQKPGTIKFMVTGRDENGKISSFQVES